jgi:hypothetical protein
MFPPDRFPPITGLAAGLLNDIDQLCAVRNAYDKSSCIGLLSLENAFEETASKQKDRARS